MNRGGTVGIVALVTHARHVAATERERFAAALREDAAGRAFILETCHRVEAYLGDEDAGARLARALPAGGEVLTAGQAVRHAITVAVGRDSVVVGEDQILHQLRASVGAARAAATLDPSLERLFALALHAGRRARSWRQTPARSLADVALSSIEAQAGSVRGRDVLIVGAGRMGRLAARAAVAAGASVAVANRSPDTAEALAASTGARTVPFDPGPGIDRFVGVIVALAGPWPIGARTVAVLARGSAVVADLSVPAAVPSSLAEKLGGRLVTADALAVADTGLSADDASAARLDELVERSVGEYMGWLQGRDGRSAAAALRRRADREREAELEALWRQVPDLDGDARRAIEGMTRHLADRLLREPLERLGRDTDGREGRAIRDIFAL